MRWLPTAGCPMYQSPITTLGVRTSDDLAVYLLEKYELATLPGSAFGSPPEDLSLRLSSSYLDASTDEKATGLVEAFLSDPRPEQLIENHHPQLREAASRLAEFTTSLQQNHKLKNSTNKTNARPKKQA